jgi:integrase/recombinase XerD
MNSKLNKKMQAAVDDFLTARRLEGGLSANTINAYERDLVQFLNQTKLGSPHKITREHVRQYIGDLNALGLNPSTVNRSLTAIKEFLRHLHGDVIDSWGLRGPKLSRRFPTIPSHMEIEKVLAVPSLKRTGKAKEDVLPNRDIAILEVLYACGLRISELIDLRLQDYDTENGILHVRGKGSKHRIVPFGDIARRAVDRYLEDSRPILTSKEKSDVSLFVNRQGKGFSRSGMWKLIREYILKAGIKKKVSPHTFRHTFATHLHEAGADIRVIQELLGHSSVNTTQIYTRISAMHLRQQHKMYHPRAKASPDYLRKLNSLGKKKKRSRK